MRSRQMSKVRTKRIISLATVITVAAALITVTALFAAGVFFAADNPFNPYNPGNDGSNSLNYGVFGGISTETGTVGKGYASTDGTAIGSGDAFRNVFSTSTGDVSGNHYLTSDVSLSAAQFGSVVVYNGTFDGNGRTITVDFSGDSANPTVYSNFQAIGDYKSGVVAAGMFGRRVRGTVKNVTIVIKGYLKATSAVNTGVAFGIVAGWVDGTVENVHVVIDGGVTMENSYSTSASGNRPDISLGGFAGVSGTSSVKAKFYNVKLTVNGKLAASGGTVDRHVFIGGIVGVPTGADINYAHLAGGADSIIAIEGTAGWRMCGGIVGGIRPDVGRFSGVNDNYVYIDNIILTYEGSWTNAAASENYIGAVIGIAYDQGDNSGVNTNGGTNGVEPILIVTNYESAPNLTTGSVGGGSTAQNITSDTTANPRKTTQLYAAARANVDCSTHVSITAKDTVLGVAYDARGTSSEARLLGISGTMTGWIPSGISASPVAEFIEDTSDTNMGGYVRISEDASESSGNSWNWITNYSTEDIGSVPEPYGNLGTTLSNNRALGTPIATASDFTSIFGTTGVVRGRYYLASDITLPSSYGGSGAEFFGVLDGMGHTVTISGSAFSNGAQYENTSNKSTGGIVGKNCGEIYNLKVRLEGSVSVSDSLGTCIAFGGVAGYNAGFIKNVETTVASGATVSVSARNGAIAVGAVAGVSNSQTKTAEIYNCRAVVNGAITVQGSGAFVAVGGAIGVMGAGNVNGVEIAGQGVIEAGSVMTPAYAYVGGAVGAVNPGSVNSNYPTDGQIVLDNTLLNYYGELSAKGTTKAVGATAGYVKAGQAAYVVRTLSTYAKPLVSDGSAYRNPSVDGLGGIDALGTIASSGTTAANLRLYVQYARYSLIYDGTSSFSGIAAHYDGPEEAEGAVSISHPDEMTVTENGNAELTVVIKPLSNSDANYSWNWKIKLNWLTIDTSAKFLRAFYRDLSDTAEDGVVNGYFQILGDITLSDADFATLTPKVIGANTIIDGLGTSSITLNRRDYTLSTVSAGSYYPNSIAAAGIIGAVNLGTIKNVKVVISGAVTASETDASLAVGGIVGINAGQMLNCTVEVVSGGTLYAGVSGTTAKDAAVGGIAGVSYGDGAKIGASTAKIDGTLGINALAASGNAAVGGIVGSLGKGSTNSYNGLKGGGNIGVAAADNSANYAKTVGGIVGSAQNGYGNADGGSGLADAEGIGTVDCTVLDFGGKYLRAGGANSSDAYGVMIGKASDTAASGNASIIYSTRAYWNTNNMAFDSDGKASVSDTLKLVGNFTHAQAKTYYQLLYYEGGDVLLGTDYSVENETVTGVTLIYNGDELVWGIESSPAPVNCYWNSSNGRIFTVAKGSETFNVEANYAGKITFTWSKPKEFDGDTATGDTLSGNLKAISVPGYNDGWATDYGRVMSGYGVPEDAYEISSVTAFQNWINLPSTAEGYAYGYLSADLTITNSLAGSATTLAAGRTFDGAGRKITINTGDWVCLSSYINTNTLAGYGGDGGASPNLASNVTIMGGVVAYNAGTIKNLTMSVEKQTVTWRTYGNDYGGLVGGIVGVNSGTIENCNLRIEAVAGANDTTNFDAYGFIVHKQGRSDNVRRVLSVGGLVGANMNGKVRYSGATVNGALKACNSGTNNNSGVCYVGGVIGMQSGGAAVAEYLTVKGSGSVVNLSNGSSNDYAVGGIIGAANMDSGNYSNMGDNNDGVRLKQSTIRNIHFELDGKIAHGGACYVGRTVGMLHVSLNGATLSGYSSNSFNAADTTWKATRQSSGNSSRTSAATPFVGLSRDTTLTINGGKMYVREQSPNYGYISPNSGYYNVYFDYWVKDTRLAIEFEHPSVISFNSSSVYVDNRLGTESRFVLTEGFYSGSGEACIHVDRTSVAGDAVAFGNMRYSDTVNTSGTQITSGTSFPLTGSGTYYLNSDVIVNLANTGNGGIDVNSINVFTGTIEGNGHTITFRANSGVIFNRRPNCDTNGIGLLVDKMESGTIRNIKVAVEAIGEIRYTRYYRPNGSGNEEGRDCAWGPLVGWMTGGTVDNVKVTTSGNINSDSNTTWYKLALGGMIGRMTGGTVKNSLSVANATFNGNAGTDRFSIDYLYGGVVGHMTGGTLDNVALSGNGTYTYLRPNNKTTYMGLIAVVLDGQRNNSQPIVNNPWFIDCNITIADGKIGNYKGVIAGPGSGTANSNNTLRGTNYKTGSIGTGDLYPSSTSSRNLIYYTGNADFSAYTGNQDITEATIPLGGDNMGGGSAKYSLYIDRQVIFNDSFTTIVKFASRNAQRGYFVWRAADIDYYGNNPALINGQFTIGSSEVDWKTGWKLGQKGKLYLTDGNGNKQTSNQTSSKAFDGSAIATTVKAGDPDKYAWTYKMYDWSGNFQLAWTNDGNSGADYDPLIRLGSAAPGTSETISASGRANSSGYYFFDPMGRFVKASHNTPATLDYSITDTTLIVSPIASSGWEETRSANFLVPRGEMGSILQLVFYEDASCSKVAFEQGFDTYEYTANVGINMLIERQSAVGGSIYYVVAYYKDENSSSAPVPIGAPAIIEVEVDNNDPVISVSKTKYTLDALGSFVAEKTITVDDVSTLTHTILTQPNVSVAVSNSRYGVYTLTFTETADVSFSVTDAVGREASVEFLIDVEPPQMTLDFNTSRYENYENEEGERVPVNFINSNGHQINVQTLSDNYVDEIYLSQHFYWRVTDRDGNVLYEGQPSDFNLANYVLSLNFQTPVHYEDCILEVWTEDSVGHVTMHSIGGGEGGVDRLIIDTRQFAVSASASHISKEGTPLPYTQAPVLRITDAVTGYNRTVNMGAQITLRRFDAVAVANPYAANGFTYVGFGADVDNRRVSGSADAINPDDESLDTDVFGSSERFVIDGKDKNGAAFGTSVNLILFYRLMLSVDFNGDRIREAQAGTYIETSNLVGDIFRVRPANQRVTIADSSYIEVTVRDESGMVLDTDRIDGSVENIYTVSFDILERFERYYEIDTSSATNVLSIVNPDDPVLEFRMSDLSLTYGTNSDGFIGKWEGTDRSALGWTVKGVKGIINNALGRAGSSIRKTVGGVEVGYEYTMFLADYLAANSVDFYDDFNYTLRRDGRIVEGVERILDAGNYSITVYIPSKRGFVGSFTLNVTVGKKTVYGYAFSQETIYGNGLASDGYCFDWERAADGGVLAADRIDKRVTYLLDGDNNAYYLNEKNTKVIVGTFADNVLTLRIGGSATITLAATQSGNSITVSTYEFAAGAYSSLPQLSTTRVNVGTYNGYITLSGGVFANYEMRATNAPTLVITKRPITIVIANTQKGYNTADPATFNWAPSATEGLGFAPGDNAASFNTVITRDAGEIVGQMYQIRGTFTNANYDITVVNGYLEVVRLQLQYIMTGLDGAYSDDVTNYLGTVGAIIRNANAADSLTVTVVYRLGYGADNQPIFVDKNYDVLTMNEDGTFTLAEDAAVVNKDTRQFFGKLTTDGTTVQWLDAVWTKEGSYVYRLLVSSNPYNATVLSNYAYDNTEDRTFVISPRPITLVVLDQTIRYGDAINSTGGLNSTFKLQGLPAGVTIPESEFATISVNKDRAAVFVGQYTSALYVNNGQPTLTIRDTDGRSYACSVVRGNLTIDQRELNITWNSAVSDTLVYDGTNQRGKVVATINASSAVSNVVSGDNRYLSLSYQYYNATGTAVSSFTNAGGYYVKAVLSGDRAGNYYLNPTYETKYVNIDKAMTELEFFGSNWNEAKPALPYKVFSSGSKHGSDNNAIFNVSCTDRNANIYVSSSEVLNGSSNHGNFNTRWKFIIAASSGTGWVEYAYTGWNKLLTEPDGNSGSLGGTLPAGTYEMWVTAPETANYYGASGRCMFTVADQTGTPPTSNGIADSSYNSYTTTGNAKLYAQNPNKTVIIREGTNTINFSGGYGGFVGMNSASNGYAVGQGVTLSNGGGALNKKSNNDYHSISWGYIYANIELTPELYMAQQNGKLRLSVSATASSNHYVYTKWNYNNADESRVMVKAIKNSSYYGFGRSDANEGTYETWAKGTALSPIKAFGEFVVDTQIGAAGGTYNNAVSAPFSSMNSSAYRIYLYAQLHADDWDFDKNYTSMNVTFSNVSITATVDDSATPLVDTSAPSVNGNGVMSGTGLVVSSGKTINGVTETYNAGAKYYQITLRDDGVGINPYTFKAVFGRNGKSDLTYISGKKTSVNANLIAGVAAIPQEGNTTGNTNDYRTIAFITPFLSSDITSIKSIEVTDYKGNKLTHVFQNATIDNVSPVILKSSLTVDESEWYKSGQRVGFTVSDENLEATKVKLYYYGADGARKEVAISHSGNGNFTTNSALTVNALYYIEASDRNGNKTVQTFYFHIDPQSETSAPPLEFTVDVEEGQIIESDFDSPENAGKWNTGSVIINAKVMDPEGNMGDGLGKFEYLALDVSDEGEVSDYNDDNYKGDTYADRWRALSLDFDGGAYTSVLTLSAQQQKLYVMRFATEAGNYIYRKVGLVKIDSVKPQIFGTVADMDGKLAQSGKWVGKGITFNISGVNGLAKGTLQYKAGNGNWTSTGFDGAGAVVTDSYFAATLTLKNNTLNGVNYQFRFVPGSGDEKNAVFLTFDGEDFFNVKLDLTKPQIETETSDWQADQATATILTSDIGSGVADVIVFELDDDGNRVKYFTTNGAFGYALDGEGNLAGSPDTSDNRRVVYDSGEYRFEFGAKTYVIRAVDAVGNMTEENYKPQVDDVVPEFDLSVISYESIDAVGFGFVDSATLIGSTPDEVFGNAANFDKGFEIANGKKILFVAFGSQRYVGFSGGTGTNYTLYDGSSDRTFSGQTSPLEGLGFANLTLIPKEARVRAASADGTAIYNVIDPSHSYANGEWTTETVRFILTSLKVGKSGGTLYYSNNGMSDIASDWTAVYTVPVDISRPDNGQYLSGIDAFVEAAGDRYMTYTFRFISLSGVRVYYNFNTGASEQRSAAAVTNGDYNFTVAIDDTAPEILGVEYRMDGTSFWSSIAGLSVTDWFTRNINIRFAVNDLFDAARSSGIKSVVLRNTTTGAETELRETDGYYSFVMTETSGFIITATDNVGRTATYELAERKIDTVPLKMTEKVYSDFDTGTVSGNDYTSNTWATATVGFVITIENGVSGGVLTYSLSGAVDLTDGLVLVSESVSDGKTVRTYYLLVDNDVEYAEYSFALKNEAGDAVYSQRTTAVKLDKTLPVISMDVIEGTLPTGDNWSTTPVTLGIRVSDLTSGIVAGSFTATVDGTRLDLERNEKGQYVLHVSDMREYVFTVRDNAGNVREEKISFNIDATPPVWASATPVEAYTDFDKATGTGNVYDTTVGNWSVKPVTLVFNVKFNATAERAGIIEYSTDNGVNWNTLFACGDSEYRLGEEKFYYTFKDGETLADVNEIFTFRAKSLSGIGNEGENPTGYKVKVDQTTLSIAADYSYANGEWTTPWANRDLKVTFDATFGLSGATLQVSKDDGTTWADVRTYNFGETVEDYLIAAEASSANYRFRLVKTASDTVTEQTEARLVRFDTATPELTVAAENTISGTRYTKGSWSCEGVTFRFTLVMGASYGDSDFIFSKDNGQTFEYMWRTENGSLVSGYTHANMRDFAVSAASGGGLDARYTVTFSFDVTDEIVQTRYMFAVNCETRDTEIRGNGYYRIDRSFNDVNSVRIDRTESLFLEVSDGSKVTVVKGDGTPYDYSALGNWYNGNVTFTFNVRSYASGGNLRYRVDGGAWTSESIIRGAVTRGTDELGRTYADTVYTLTVNYTVNSTFEFAAQSTAGRSTEYEENGSAVLFNVSVDKNLPVLINNNLSYYRADASGNYTVPYAPSANSYISDDGVLAVFSIADGDSGVTLDGVTVSKNGTPVAVSPYRADGSRYEFMITDSNTYTLTVRDAAGNTIVRSFRIGVDSVTPVISANMLNTDTGDWITDALRFGFAGSVFGSSGGFVEYSVDGGSTFKVAGAAEETFVFPENYFNGTIVFRAVSNAGKVGNSVSFSVKVDCNEYGIDITQIVGSFTGNYADVILSKNAPYKRGDVVTVTVIAGNPYSFLAYEADGGERTEVGENKSFDVSFTDDGDIADKQIVLRFGEELYLSYSNLSQSVQFDGVSYGTLTSPVQAITQAGNVLTNYLTVTYTKDGVSYALSDLGVFYRGTELIKRLGEFDITVSIANPDYKLSNATGRTLSVRYFAETGTETDPFVLRSEEDFAFINEETYSGADCYFVLGRDVTINDTRARITSAFKGHLDGKNRSIILGAQLAERGLEKGLFDVLDGAVVSNLGFKIFSTELNLTTGNKVFGTLANLAVNAEISNVFVIADYKAEGNYEGDFRFGGIVGEARGTTTFNNVYSDASFDLTGLKAGTIAAGGVYGTSDTGVTVENSYSVAVIRANKGVWAGMFGGDGKVVGNTNKAVESNVYIGGRWVPDTREGATEVGYANLYNGTNYVLNSRYSGIASPVRVGDIVKLRFDSDFYGAYSVVGDRITFEVSEMNGFNAVDKYLWAEFTQSADIALGNGIRQTASGRIGRGAEFRGVYDGNGFSIELNAAEVGSYALFDTVRGTVKNVTLTDIELEVSLTEGGFASVLVGTLRGGRIENAVVGGTFKVNAEASSDEVSVAVIAAKAEENAVITDVLVSALMTVSANLLELGAVSANIKDSVIDNAIVISTVNATVDKRASLGAVAGTVSGSSEITDAYALSGNTYLDGSSYDVLIGYDRTTNGVAATYTDFDTVMTRNNYFIAERDVSDVLRKQFESEFEGGGIGTVTAPFIIENAADFAKISRYMFANYEIRPMIVGADGNKVAANYLDFGDNFETVGRGMMFTGSLRGTAISDGNGGWVWVTLKGVTDSLFDMNYGTISLMNITANVNKRLTVSGTFGLIANENYGTIRQVDVSGSIGVSMASSSELTAGVIAGKNVGGTITETIVSATFTVRGINVTAGLIAGTVEGDGGEPLITKCLAEGVLKVTGNFVNAGVYAGYVENSALMDVENITSDDPRLILNVKG